MAISVFLSTVSDEFRPYRDQLNHALTRHNVAVKVQEDFKGLGASTLDKLDTYIAHCDAVIHLVGDMTGATPAAIETQSLLQKYQDLPTRLPPLHHALAAGEPISYTQWEAWLALYHNKTLLIAQAAPYAPRSPAFAPSDASRSAQAAHLARLQHLRRYPDCTFDSPADLARHILATAILDLLVTDYAAEIGRARDIAHGFIAEMAARVTADPDLDFEGKQQAVRNAIDIYATEIATRPTSTNFGDITDRALAEARRRAAAGQSRLARATLRSTAESLHREEAERRAAHTERLTALYGGERDIALAAYDGDAAADAILAMAQALHPKHRPARRALLITEGDSLEQHGDQRGSNIHLLAAIALRRATLHLASTSDEIGFDQAKLGIALWRLGERDSGTARLEQAVTAFRAALEEYTRERVPLDWATTQMCLGNAFARLGERESGTARLEQAVTAFHAALKECTREHMPLIWAMTHMNLGNALARLGERERGTVRLEQAVVAYRIVLSAITRERVPLDWALTQNNLGNALATLGERESGTAHLEEAVTAYCAALEERTRERVPLQWATTQMNLGYALRSLGERESGTARLEEAVTAYRAALEEYTSERVPFDWAMTQMNLGKALRSLGERETGILRLEQAVAAFAACLSVTESVWPGEWVQETRVLSAETQAEIARRQTTQP